MTEPTTAVATQPPATTVAATPPAAPVAPPAAATPPVSADTAVADAVTAERKRAADIHAACQMVGKADKAVAFIADGKSLSEVVAALQADRRAANPPDVNARHSASDTSRELPKPDLNASEIYSTRAKARSQRAAV